MNDRSPFEWQTYVPDQRDDLFERVRRGELKPQQAEDEAQRLGLEPLSSRPDPGAFDPARKSRWSLAMVLAWIVWRDMAEVREWDSQYRADCWDWQPSRYRLASEGEAAQVFDGFAVVQRSPASGEMFEAFGYIPLSDRHTAFRPGNAPVQAKRELWDALLDGKLTAEGVPASGGARIDVPSREWADIEDCTGGGSPFREYFRYRHHPLGRAYDDILWMRDEVRGIWPPIAEPEAPSGQPHSATRRMSHAAADREFKEWLAALDAAFGD